jgi:hypothetical protein
MTDLVRRPQAHSAQIPKTAMARAPTGLHEQRVEEMRVQHDVVRLDLRPAMVLVEEGGWVHGDMRQWALVGLAGWASVPQNSMRSRQMMVEAAQEDAIPEFHPVSIPSKARPSHSLLVQSKYVVEVEVALQSVLVLLTGVVAAVEWVQGVQRAQCRHRKSPLWLRKGKEEESRVCERVQAIVLFLLVLQAWVTQGWIQEMAEEVASTLVVFVQPEGLAIQLEDPPAWARQLFQEGRAHLHRWGVHQPLVHPRPIVHLHLTLQRRRNLGEGHRRVV